MVAVILYFLGVNKVTTRTKNSAFVMKKSVAWFTAASEHITHFLDPSSIIVFSQLN